MHTLPDVIKPRVHTCFGVQLVDESGLSHSIWFQLSSSSPIVQLAFQSNKFQLYILAKLYNKIIKRSSQFYILNYAKYHYMITIGQVFWQSAQGSKFSKVF